MGDTVTVEAFEVGQVVKVSGSRRARASRGRSSATTSTPARSRTARTTCAPRARSARRRPPRAFQGHPGPGRMGGGRMTQRGLEIVELMPDRNLMLVRGSVPGPRAAPWRCAPMAEAPCSAPRHMLDDASSAPRSTARSCTRSSSPTSPRAGGARTRPRRAARCGRRLEAVAPEGHGPRPRRLQRSPLWTGGGTVFGPQPRPYTVKVNRKARKAALRRCSPCTRSARSSSVRRGRLRRAEHQARRRAARGPPPRRARRARRRRVAAAKSFRNLAGVSVIPTEAAASPTSSAPPAASSPGRARRAPERARSPPCRA